MRSFAPCLAVCLAGALLALYAGVALATMPGSRGGEARVVIPKTTKAPLRLVVPRTERGGTITQPVPAWALVASSLPGPDHGFVRDKRG